MKKVMLGCVLVVALLLGGCDEEAFTPEMIQSLAAQNEVLQQQLDNVQAVAREVAAEIRAAGVVDWDVKVKLDKVNEEVDRVQAQIDKIAQALQDVELTGDAAQDFIAQLQAVNAASAGVNPYVLPVGGVLTALSIVLGWIAKRNGAEASKQTKKYQAHKQGVELTMKEVSASSDSDVVAIEAQLYANIGAARSSLGV